MRPILEAFGWWGTQIMDWKKNCPHIHCRAFLVNMSWLPAPQKHLLLGQRNLCRDSRWKGVSGWTQPLLCSSMSLSNTIINMCSKWGWETITPTKRIHRNMIRLFNHTANLSIYKSAWTHVETLLCLHFVLHPQKTVNNSLLIPLILKWMCDASVLVKSWATPHFFWFTWNEPDFCATFQSSFDQYFSRLFKGLSKYFYGHWLYFFKLIFIFQRSFTRCVFVCLTT